MRALRAGRDQHHGHLADDFERADVLARLGRQVAELGRASRRRGPALQRFVDRRARGELRRVAGHLGDDVRSALIRRAHLQLIEAVEHVELGDGDRGHPVDADRVADRHGVEPSAASRPARGRAVLLARLAQSLAHRIEELGRQRSSADARRVRLRHAEHGPNRSRPDARVRSRRRRRSRSTRSRTDTCRGRCRAACLARLRTSRACPRSSRDAGRATCR